MEEAQPQCKQRMKKSWRNIFFLLPFESLSHIFFHISHQQTVCLTKEERITHQQTVCLTERRVTTVLDVSRRSPGRDWPGGGHTPRHTPRNSPVTGAVEFPLIFISLDVCHVTCHVSRVTCNITGGVSLDHHSRFIVGFYCIAMHWQIYVNSMKNKWNYLVYSLSYIKRICYIELHCLVLSYTELITLHSQTETSLWPGQSLPPPRRVWAEWRERRLIIAFTYIYRVWRT